MPLPSLDPTAERNFHMFHKLEQNENSRLYVKNGKLYEMGALRKFCVWLGDKASKGKVSQGINQEVEDLINKTVTAVRLYLINTNMYMSKLKNNEASPQRYENDQLEVSATHMSEFENYKEFPQIEVQLEITERKRKFVASYTKPLFISDKLAEILKNRFNWGNEGIIQDLRVRYNTAAIEVSRWEKIGSLKDYWAHPFAVYNDITDIDRLRVEKERELINKIIQKYISKLEADHNLNVATVVEDSVKDVKATLEQLKNSYGLSLRALRLLHRVQTYSIRPKITETNSL